MRDDAHVVDLAALAKEAADVFVGEVKAEVAQEQSFTAFRLVFQTRSIVLS